MTRLLPRAVAWLRQRLAERSTLIGLGLVAAAIVAAAWEWRIALQHIAAAALGALLAGVPDAVLRQAWPLLEAAADLPAPSGAIAAGTFKESSMTDFETILAGVEAQIQALVAAAEARAEPLLEEALGAHVAEYGEAARQLFVDLQAAHKSGDPFAWGKALVDACALVGALAHPAAAPPAPAAEGAP